ITNKWRRSWRIGKRCSADGSARILSRQSSSVRLESSPVPTFPVSPASQLQPIVPPTSPDIFAVVSRPIFDCERRAKFTCSSAFFHTSVEVSDPSQRTTKGWSLRLEQTFVTSVVLPVFDGPVIRHNVPQFWIAAHNSRSFVPPHAETYVCVGT